MLFTLVPQSHGVPFFTLTYSSTCMHFVKKRLRACRREYCCSQVDADKVKIGTVTSGRTSPMTNEHIAIGYVDKPHNKSGTKLQVKVRTRFAEAEVVKMPFVPTKYYKPA